MSCYNWEAGTIQLPKPQFGKIKKEFVADYNKILETQMHNANRLVEHVLTINKGKRNVKWQWELDEHANRFDVTWATLCLLGHVRGGKKPKKLTKKAMNFANGKTMGFDINGEGWISFDPEHKTVTYNVGENNRAVERARESYVGKLFFRTMKNVNWTPNSGGTLYGNDEYNRENSYGDVGGGNYVTAQFGRDAIDKCRNLW